MRFAKWAEYHNKTVERVGNHGDRTVEFDTLTVTITDERSNGPTVVRVLDEENPQQREYSALLSDVKFTRDGIEGKFEPNRESFTITELNTF